MYREELAWYERELGTHWTIRVVAAASAGPPGVQLGLAGGGQVIEIRNLDTGSIGTLTLLEAQAGVGIGIGLSAGNGTSAYFETERPENIGVFQGPVQTRSVQVLKESLYSTLTLPLDIKNNTLWESLWTLGGVDVRATANSVGLGASGGFGVMVMIDIVRGPPDVTLVETMLNAIAHCLETTYGVADANKDGRPDTTLAPLVATTPYAMPEGTGNGAVAAPAQVDDPDDGGETSDLDDPDDGGETSDLGDPDDGGQPSGDQTSDLDDPGDGAGAFDADVLPPPPDLPPLHGQF